MSARFAPDWLALREPYDARARNGRLLGRLAAWRRRRDQLHVVDLGAGTGSNLRALAPALGGAQSWTLVERDQELIDRGAAQLAGAEVDWRYRRLDLATDLERLGDGPVDLITASALIDLVSAPWLERLARWRRVTGTALYVVLTYDGRIDWEPVQRLDRTVADLVNRHQRVDKGFGPALGPDAAGALGSLMTERDGTVATAGSDWTLVRTDGQIQRALLTGYEQAAVDMAPPRRDEIRAWAEQRQRMIGSGSSTLTVGHQDLLLLPPG